MELCREKVARSKEASLHVLQGCEGGRQAPAARNGARQTVVVQRHCSQALEAVCGPPACRQGAAQLVAMHIKPLKRLQKAGRGLISIAAYTRLSKQSVDPQLMARCHSGHSRGRIVLDVTAT